MAFARARGLRTDFADVLAGGVENVLLFAAAAVRLCSCHGSGGFALLAVVARAGAADLFHSRNIGAHDFPGFVLHDVAVRLCAEVQIVVLFPCADEHEAYYLFRSVLQEEFYLAAGRKTFCSSLFDLVE